MGSKSSNRWKGTEMNQAAVDALVLGMGTFFLGGYAVGLILKFLTGRWDYQPLSRSWTEPDEKSRG